MATCEEGRHGFDFQKKTIHGYTPSGRSPVDGKKNMLLGRKKGEKGKGKKDRMNECKTLIGKSHLSGRSHKKITGLNGPFVKGLIVAEGNDREKKNAPRSLTGKRGEREKRGNGFDM